MRFLIVLGVAVSLSACSNASSSNLNPFNWFGGNEDEVSEIEPRGGYDDQVDARPIVGTIKSVSTVESPYGVIVHVVAQMPTQNYFDLDLIEAASNDPRELVFELRGWRPATPGVVGTELQRQVDLATFVSEQNIAPIRTIRIKGATNSMTARP